MKNGVIGLLSVVKLVLAVLVIVVLLAGCGRVYDLIKETDSGSLKSLNSLEKTIVFMKDKTELKDNPINLYDFGLGEDYLIVGFSKDDKVVEGINKPFKCSANLSCVVLCFGEFEEDVCGNTKDYFILDVDIESFVIKETDGIESVSVLKVDDKFKISKININ